MAAQFDDRLDGEIGDGELRLGGLQPQLDHESVRSLPLLLAEQLDEVELADPASSSRLDGSDSRVLIISPQPHVQMRDGELRGAVDADVAVELPLFGADLGDDDVEVADRVSLEALLLRSFTLRYWQPADAMSLQAAV